MDTAPQAAPVARGSFWQGLGVNLLNPAIATFYLVVVPSFMPEQSTVWRYVLMAAAHVLMALACHSLWVMGFDRLREFFRAPRARLAFEIATGVALLALAAPCDLAAVDQLRGSEGSETRRSNRVQPCIPLDVVPQQLRRATRRRPRMTAGPFAPRFRDAQGPWTSVNGVIVAETLADLHTRRGDAGVFIDEHGNRIAGQWPGTS
jgi:hypothetical protein